MNTRHVATLLALLTIPLFAGAGCQQVGIITYAFAGPAPIEPIYKIEKKPLLVLVENYRLPSGMDVTADQFAGYLTEEFRANDVAPMIDQSDLYELRSKEGANFRDLKVQDIGRAVGAQQVIYVDWQGSSTTEAPGGGLIKGKVAMRVKIIDASNGHTLWPLDAADGYPFGKETPVVREEPGVTTETVEQNLLREMALRIARRFYKWKPVDAVEASQG